MDDAIKLWDEIAANYPETNEGKDAEKYLQRYKIDLSIFNNISFIN